MLQLQNEKLSGTATCVRFKSSVTKLKVVYTRHEILSARKVLEKILTKSGRVVRERPTTNVTNIEVVTVVLEP